MNCWLANDLCKREWYYPESGTFQSKGDELLQHDISNNTCKC